MRTDIHRPSAINPEDYEFVCFDYCDGSDLGAILALQGQHELFRAHMAQTGGKYAVHQNEGSCHICGALALYICHWYCVATNEYIQTGEDCARKLDMSYGTMNAFRRAISDAREAHAGKRKAIATLSDLGLLFAWEIYTAEYPRHTETCPETNEADNGYAQPCTCDVTDRVRGFEQFEEHTIRDIVGKLVKYGSISDKQTSFLSSLINRIFDRPLIEAKRQAEKDAAGPVPTGRIEVTGVVLALKEVEKPRYYRNDADTAWKILIRLENGSKIYGNRFGNLEKGQTAKLVATIEASEDDAKFGFFKRPKLVGIIEETKTVL